MTEYETPVLRELGSLSALTQQKFNKVGNNADFYSVETTNQVVGSLVPAQ